MPEPLSPDELAHIYRTWVRATYISATPPDTPTLVLLGGQPGSGLSASAAQILQAHPGMYEISANDLKRFHPQAVALSSSTSRAAADELASASALWARALTHDSKSTGQSILLRGGFTDPEATLQLARDYAEAGYSVEVAVNATPRRDSLLNALGAPLNAAHDRVKIQSISLPQHDRAYEAIGAFLSQVHDEPAISRLSIIDRAGEYAHDRFRPETFEDAHIALEQVRSRPMSAPEAKVWLPELRRLDDHIVRTGAANASTLPYLRELHAIAEAEAIPALGLAPDSPARKLLETRSREDLAAITAASGHTTPDGSGPHHALTDEINSSVER